LKTKELTGNHTKSVNE